MGAAPLTRKEQTELGRLEATIESGLRTFIEVGKALSEIRDARLYRATHETFEDYCRIRWSMSRGHAYRLIAGASVMEQLPEVSVLPASESQVRPLSRLPMDQQAEAWEEVVKACAGGRITASLVSEVVDQMLAGDAPRRLQKETPQAGVRWVDRDRLVADLRIYAAQHEVKLPKKILEFLEKY